MIAFPKDFPDKLRNSILTSEVVAKKVIEDITKIESDKELQRKLKQKIELFIKMAI